MKHDTETAQPAPVGQVERGVGRPVPERAELMRQLTNAQREVRTWPEWMTAHATMPRWMLEWDDHA